MMLLLSSSVRLCFIQFFCFDNDSNTPASICFRVRNAYMSEGYDVNIPPVRRIPIVCTGHEGEIYIDDVVTDAQL